MGLPGAATHALEVLIPLILRVDSRSSEVWEEVLTRLDSHSALASESLKLQTMELLETTGLLAVPQLVGVGGGACLLLYDLSWR